MFHYFHALRHLKPVQIYGQIRNRIVAKTFSSDYWTKRAQTLSLGECGWNPIGEFLPPGVQTNSAKRMKEGFLSFLNVEKNPGWPFHWSSADHTKLWEYNLHYFEYLFALEYDDARQLVLDWTEKHPLARNACGWEPYPVSLRLMNWTACFYGRWRGRTASDEQFETILKRSLAMQAEWLVYRLEYHLLGNHYLENAAALAFIGSCFDGANAKRWFKIGAKILHRELPEQILGDGTHFERSPMYHCRIVYLLELLADTGNERLREIVEPFRKRAAVALSKLCHPDGEIALFNDAAFGIYNAPEQLCEIGDNFATETFSLPDAGYFGAKTNNGHYLLCDAGSIGPDYISGHAHGDIFSFELSLFGKRMIVDSGTYDYIDSPERRYSRSTMAHNTVEINRNNQCEFFDAFKVGRRGRPHDVKFEETETGFRLSGWHDGYRRFPAKAVHHRSFEWNHSGSLVITDRVEAVKEVESVVRFHLHPECRIIEQNGGNVIIARDSIALNMKFSCGKINITQYDYLPEFGIKHPADMLEISVAEKSIELTALCKTTTL